MNDNCHHHYSFFIFFLTDTFHKSTPNPSLEYEEKYILSLL